MALGSSISLDRYRSGRGALEISPSLYIAGQKSVAFLTFKATTTTTTTTTTTKIVCT